METFYVLFDRAIDQEINISAKEKHSFRRSLVSKLEQYSIEDADSIADTLVDIGILNNSGLENSNKASFLKTSLSTWGVPEPNVCPLRKYSNPFNA